MKSFFLFPLLIFFFLFNFSCNKKKKTDLSRTDFIYIKGKKFKHGEKDFFPIMLNYVITFRKIGDQFVVAGIKDYEDKHIFEGGNSVDSTLKVLRGHMQLIKELGFNSIRLVGLDRINVKKIHSSGQFKSLSLNEIHNALLKSINQFLDIAKDLDLRVMLLNNGPIDNNEQKQFTIKLLKEFKDNPTIFAYDFMNEPLYFDNKELPPSKRTRTKESAYKIVSDWKDLMTKYAPYQLMTIGFSEPIEVFEWDPSILPVDFVEFHTYHPLRVPSEIYWYSKYVGKPWMIGETSLPADNDSISYKEQKQFLKEVYQKTLDCGGAGFGWWSFQDVQWGGFEHDYTSIMNHEGITTTKDKKYIIKGTLKPVAYEFNNLKKIKKKRNCKIPENYYNILGYNNYVIKGKIINSKNGKPIEGAVIRGWSKYWDIAANTFTNEYGEYTLYSNIRFEHFEISAPGMSTLIFNNNVKYKPTNSSVPKEEELKFKNLEYHKISYQPFVKDSIIFNKDYIFPDTGNFIFNFNKQAFNTKKYIGIIKTKKLVPLNIGTRLFSNSDEISNKRKFTCDLEKIDKKKGRFLDKFNEKILYKGINNISHEYSHSGQTSILLNKEHPYGLETIIENVKPGKRFKISVWKKRIKQKNIGIIVATSIKSKSFFFQNIESKKKDKNGWEQIELIFTIPPSIVDNKLKIFVWQPTEGDVYFDDLSIQELEDERYPFYDNEKSLNIYIEKKDYAKLQQIRKKAYQTGIIETNEDSWIKAVIFYDNQVLKSKIRIKGDWLDHIEGKKWSFRIKIKKNKAWKSFKVFSIQNPKTRFYMGEWVAHKLFKYEDILTTEYGFIPIIINNESLGIYAFEEHFAKQLVESKKRREGVIVKLSEDAFWANIKTKREKKKWFNVPIFETSKIIPFEKKNITNNNKLNNYFKIAQNLLYEFKWNKKKTSEIFDINQISKFFALMDLTKSYHGLRWHNLRFYYNPIISKLEIIAYDGYTEKGVFDWVKRPIFGNFNTKEAINSKPENHFFYNLFSDSSFVNRYIYYLNKFSKKSFIDTFYNSIDKEYLQYKQLLQKEDTLGLFKRKLFYDNAKAIQKELPEYTKKVESGLYKNFTFLNYPKKEYKCEYNKNIFPLYIHAHKQKDHFYKIINYYPLPIELIGTGKKDNIEFINNFSTIINIEKYNSIKNEKTIRIKDIYDKYIYCRVKGQKDIVPIPIMPWPAPETTTPLQILNQKNNFNSNKIFKVINNKIYFNKGKFTIDKNIIIPKGYEVYFNEQTELNFVNKAFFLSYSSIKMNGTKEKKIKIYSSDGTSMGFIILQADKKSIINNVIFNNLNTLNYMGWILSGAVNFYESEVEITNTSFLNNKCEDALNIIRSNFNVHNCYFENIFSDAFDADFCTGKLSNSNFKNIGNDAIDFSGSKINIQDCNINTAGDKGISAGEESFLIINNCSVNNANIGYASKDKSKITITNCKVVNSHYGLVALKKKPEYGPAKIFTKNIELNNILTPYLIEKESILKLNNKIIIGTKKNIAKRFY